MNTQRFAAACSVRRPLQLQDRACPYVIYMPWQHQSSAASLPQMRVPVVVSVAYKSRFSEQPIMTRGAGMHATDLSHTQTPASNVI